MTAPTASVRMGSSSSRVVAFQVVSEGQVAHFLEGIAQQNQRDNLELLAH